MSSRPTDTITAMLGPLTLFEARCKDNATLRKLIAIAKDDSRHGEAHDLFSEIRMKTLAAGRRRDGLALAQYAFEEICAKTLYNLSAGEIAPFDADSPFWVLPLAVEFGAELGITDPAAISPLLRCRDPQRRWTRWMGAVKRRFTKR